MSINDLREPFHSSKIHWRVGSTNLNKDGSLKWGEKPMAKPLAYLDARDVMERLDKSVGQENWQCEYPWSDGKKVVCRIGIRIRDEWIWKSNGAGDTQVEGEKGSMSDAFKRAAVLWGVGQYLYDCKMGWYEMDKYRSFDKATMTTINKDYESWMISSEGPLKSLVERQKILSQHLESVTAVKRGIQEGDLSSASEEWYSLPEEAQNALFFAPSRGGIFTTKEIEVMRTTEFREANGAQAA